MPMPALIDTAAVLDALPIPAKSVSRTLACTASLTQPQHAFRNTIVVQASQEAQSVY